MSKRSVYEGLKTALRIRDLPFHHVDDEACTIAFESWEQFAPFDCFLDSVSTPDGIKLCIYAERVAGRSDGVAVTVSDEVQHLCYMTSRLDMENKLAVFEELLSRLYRKGISRFTYDYELFTVAFPKSEYNSIVPQLQNGSLIAEEYYVSEVQDRCTIHLEFAT